jgi:glycosyltransferase involved in cell wall biosynthesis
MATSMVSRRVVQQRSLKVGVVAGGDPYDVRLFSGTTRNMTLALERIFGNVTVVRRPRPAWYGLLRSAISKLSRGTVDLNFSRLLARRHAAAIVEQLDQDKPDLVFSVAQSPITAELAEHYPVVHVSDATFQLMEDFYKTFSRLGESWRREGEAMERDAINKSLFVTVSSPWAARSVIDDYGTDPAKVAALSWGCNIPFVPADDVGPIPAEDAICRLLFVGLDWTRKGGDIVVATADILRERGFPFHLDLVGVGADEPVAAEDIEIHGVLRKDEPDELERLLSLFRGASLLFLPTRQDCTPMVFAEANAYGVPALARDVGGVTGVIDHGVNGLVLEAEATPEAFADSIMALWADRDRYNAMRLASRAAYEGRLNWDCWAARIHRIATALVSDQVPGGAREN